MVEVFGAALEIAGDGETFAEKEFEPVRTTF
jgi:hypothetical protein